MRGLVVAATLALGGLSLVGCGDRGAVTFNLQAPSNALFNPVAQAQLVSEYDLRAASGAIIGIASAVQSSQSTGSGLLPLGALMPIGMPTDVTVTALSGPTLLGMARIKDVTVKAGAHQTYNAPLRKPIIFVGSRLPDEPLACNPPTVPCNQALPVEILDPVTALDLARAPMNPPAVLGGMSAGATTWDGMFLVMAQGTTLGAFDTGKGANVNGTLTLPFAPSRIVAAPRNQGVIALDAGSGGMGSIAIFNNLGTLVGNPANARPNVVQVRGMARTAAFSPDGNKFYVLTGSPTQDPCGPGAPTASNSIVSFGLDGSMLGMWTLPSYASDITVDRDTGIIVLADTAARQISTLDPTQPAGPAVPRKLLDNLTCPNAVRVVNGVVFAITSDHDPASPNAFILQRVTLESGQSVALSFTGPQYQISTESNPSANGDIGANTLNVRPVSLWAYDLAVTPDGSRAEFAVRAHYVENNTSFNLLTTQCMATFDIVEYGLYALDMRTGNASYAMHAQLTQMPANMLQCIDCPLGIGDVFFNCPSHAGDRPSGVTAVFGP